MTDRLQCFFVRFLCVVASAGCQSVGHNAYQAMRSEYATIDTHLRDARAADERLFSASELDRGALIRAVLDRNPSVESARQGWRAALARYRQAGALEDPMVMASFAPLSIASKEVRFGYEVGLSQRIPLGGKLGAQAALAVAEAEGSRSDYAAVRLQLALTAAELYDDYFVAVRSLEVQAEHVALMGALKQNAIAAFESGHAAAQDGLQAEAELARLEYQNSVYRAERDVAVAQLNALLHRAPDAALPPPPRELPPYDTAGDAALAKRPDIASAQARVRAARARGAAADAEYVPDLTVSTTYSSMWDMPQHRWMAGVSINLPIFRERRSGAVDEAAAMRAAMESEVQSMTDAARGEIAVALRRITEAEEAVQLYEQRLLPVARDRIEAARSGFVSSQNGFMAVIEAEHALRSAELELTLARADLDKRRAELDRARGRIPGLPGAGGKP